MCKTSFILLLIMLLFAGATLQASEWSRPNIVFFFADDQRNDTLGCAGHAIVKTPNIDRLAAEGVRFGNAFVTTSICWVSRATVLTGMWSRSHGIRKVIDNIPEFSAATVYPLLLKQSGYRTGFYGKWHTRMPKTFDRNAAFDEYEEIDRKPYFKVQERGFADNTVIIYSADNGCYMGDRGFAGKWSHYEQSICVPLIIYDPRLPPESRGRVLEQIVANVDLPSTFFDLAGQQAPRWYQGQSLMPLLQGEEISWRAELFLEHLLRQKDRIPKWEGVRNARYKYASYFEHDYEFLHDLQSDPDELENLAGDSQYDDVLAELRQRTTELRTMYEAAGSGWRP